MADPGKNVVIKVSVEIGERGTYGDTSVLKASYEKIGAYQPNEVRDLVGKLTYVAAKDVMERIPQADPVPVPVEEV